MISRIAKLFKTSKSEMSFINFASLFYFMYIFNYTVDDFKSNYPLYLIMMGIVSHIFTLLILMETNHIIVTKSGDIKRPIYFKGYSKAVCKIVPFALILTYSLSTFRGYAEMTSVYSLLFFLYMVLPIIAFLIILGYFKKKHLFLFRKKIPIINYLYMGGFFLFVILNSK